MRLYTNNAYEAELLLDAVKLLRHRSSSATEIEACDKLIARIEKCRKLQHPNCDRKGKQK